MRRAAVVGVGMTSFGRRKEGLLELLSEAALAALEDAGLERGSVDELIIANTASGELCGFSAVANILASDLSLEPARAYRIECGAGSGGAAVYAGVNSVLSGSAELVLVVGGEKMTTKETPEVAEVIASMLDEDEKRLGLTLPSLAALAATQYMNDWGATREAIAKVAVKNHYNGSLNPYAQFRKRITIEEVLNSPIVSYPLRLYDYCPVSDGAAAVLLAPLDKAKELVDKPVVFSGLGFVTDSNSVTEKEKVYELPAVKRAAEQAYRQSGRKSSEIDIAELHDMATVLEIVESEELGFFERGEGWRAAERGDTALDGKIPINTSGGLKARGHPLGATGVAQVVEVVMQLQGRCGERQVDAEVGLVCNMAGFGSGATVFVMEVAK